MSNTAVTSTISQAEAQFFFAKNSVSEKQKNILLSTILIGKELKKEFEILCRLPKGSIRSLVWAKKSFIISLVLEHRFPAKIALTRHDEAEDNVYKHYLFSKKVNNYVILCVGSKLSIPLERTVHHLSESLRSLPAKELMKYLEKTKVNDKIEF